MVRLNRERDRAGFPWESGPMKDRLAEIVRRCGAAAAPGALELAPPPAWTTPRVGQDHGRGPSWTLLHLRLALRTAHLSFDFPEDSIGADVDVTASKPDVTIPPVTVNSHESNLGQFSRIGVGQSYEKFSPAG